MRKEIEEFAEDSELPLIFFDGYDDAIVGIARRFNHFAVLYSKNKIIEILCKDMSEDEAYEFYEFNVVGAYVGEYTPVILEEIN